VGAAEDTIDVGSATEDGTNTDATDDDDDDGDGISGFDCDAWFRDNEVDEEDDDGWEEG